MASCKLPFFPLNTWIVCKCVADGQTVLLNCGCITSIWLACENSRFSSLLAAWDISRGGTSATQRQKFHTVYIINSVIVGFQMQICSILHFSWSILVKCCVHLRTSSSNTQMLLLEKYMYHKFWLFCYRFIAFMFELCSLLSYVCCLKQWLEQCNYSDIQSALMTRFWTDFTSSVWNFCRWVVDIPPGKTSLAAMSEEKRLFS